MKIIVIGILLQLIFSPFLYGQNKYINYNLKQIDSVDIVSRLECKGYKSTFKFSKKVVNYDKKRIKFLNTFYQKDLKPEDIISLLKSNFKRWHIDTINLGAATKYVLNIYDVDFGNLGLSISFASLENEIIYKRFVIMTPSKLYCKDPRELFLTETLDVKYLEKYCIPLIEFPIKYRVYSLRVTADTTYFDKLNKTNTSKYYSFTIDSIKNINEETWFYTDRYYYDYGYFKDTSALADIEMLFHFLYSPNHIIAIYAYETLIFLKHAKQMNLPSTVEEKMNKIKNSDIKIVWQTSDVIHRGVSYKDLKISPYQIITKFRKKPTPEY
jgi:hypothetical protein